MGPLWVRRRTYHSRLQGQRRRRQPSYQIECGADLAGAVVIFNPWLAGPYLQLSAVLPAHQKRGIGAQVLTWLEAEARGHFRNLWLCVSGFNTDAQRLYRQHGFEHVATLDGLVRDGDDELLMRKRLSHPAHR